MFIRKEGFSLDLNTKNDMCTLFIYRTRDLLGKDRERLGTGQYFRIFNDSAVLSQ